MGKTVETASSHGTRRVLCKDRTISTRFFSIWDRKRYLE